MRVSGGYHLLARKTPSQLEAVLQGGRAPDLESILGWEWAGYNTPPLTALLGIRKFIKFFFGRPEAAEGCNIPARQNGLDGDWLHKPSAEAPKRFGFYAIKQAGPGSPHPNALLLDYGASPRNFALAPERLLRDYVVQPDPENPDILLGKAYLALPGRPCVSFFLLERLRQNPWRPR